MSQQLVILLDPIVNKICWEFSIDQNSGRTGLKSKFHQFHEPSRCASTKILNLEFDLDPNRISFRIEVRSLFKLQLSSRKFSSSIHDLNFDQDRGRIFSAFFMCLFEDFRVESTTKISTSIYTRKIRHFLVIVRRLSSMIYDQNFDHNFQSNNPTLSGVWSNTFEQNSRPKFRREFLVV